MSTATAFKFHQPFPECPFDVSGGVPTAGGPSDTQYIGPFTLAQAMAFFWNTEAVHIAGHTLTGAFGVDPMPEPCDRVCSIDSSRFVYSTSSPYELYDIYLGSVAQDGAHYYISVAIELREAGGSGEWVFTLASDYADGITRFLETTYSATLFGLSVPLYLYRDENAGTVTGPAPPDPALVATADYYTY